MEREKKAQQDIRINVKHKKYEVARIPSPN